MSDPATRTTDWTIGRLLTWTGQFLASRGVEDGPKEARILLAHALGCKPIDLYTRYDELASDDGRARYRELVTQRVAGRPTAQLIGRREFFSLDFAITPAVLVPRPETEFLVMEATRLGKQWPTPRVLDVGTGSGCIAVSVATRLPAARVTAIDLSSEALAVAVGNAEKHGVSNRVRFLHGDLLAPLGAGERFDLVLSNPPYIRGDEWDFLPTDVREFEPRLALDGGPDGLDVYRRLIPAAAAVLNPGGGLLLEIGATQEAAVRVLVEAAGLSDVRTILDQERRPRVIVARQR